MKLTKKGLNRGSTSLWRIIYMTCTCNRISLNARLLRDLGITGGERILIAKDEDSRNDWYIAMTVEGGSKLRITKRNAYGDAVQATFNNKPAVTQILESVKATLSAKFLVSAKGVKMPDGRTWYRIFTATPKSIK